jgi:hypothetical protein
MDPVNGLLARCVSALTNTENIDAVSTGREGLGITSHPIISRVNRMANHCHGLRPEIWVPPWQNGTPTDLWNGRFRAVNSLS